MGYRVSSEPKAWWGAGREGREGSRQAGTEGGEGRRMRGGAQGRATNRGRLLPASQRTLAAPRRVRAPPAAGAPPPPAPHLDGCKDEELAHGAAGAKQQDVPGRLHGMDGRVSGKQAGEAGPQDAPGRLNRIGGPVRGWWRAGGRAGQQASAAAAPPPARRAAASRRAVAPAAHLGVPGAEGEELAPHAGEPKQDGQVVEAAPAGGGSGGGAAEGGGRTGVRGSSWRLGGGGE